MNKMEYIQRTKSEMKYLMDSGMVLEFRDATMAMLVIDIASGSPYLAFYETGSVVPMAGYWDEPCIAKAREEESPEPKYISYTTKTFPFDADKPMWVMMKEDNNTKKCIIGIAILIETRSGVLCFDTLLEDYLWLDGSRCGTIEK